MLDTAAGRFSSHDGVHCAPQRGQNEWPRVRTARGVPMIPLRLPLRLCGLHSAKSKTIATRCGSQSAARALQQTSPNLALILPTDKCMIATIRTQVRCRLLGERAAYGAVARERISCRKSGARRSHVMLPQRGGGRMTAEVVIVN